MAHSLQRNMALYPWYLAATSEGISNAVWYLYLFTYKGLSLEQMAWLVLLGNGIIVLTEVPTGWLADRLGRRFSILIGIVLQALSALLFIFGDSFGAFWAAMAVCGLGDTFRAGADQALLYDTCLAVNQEGRFRGVLAHSLLVTAIVMAFSQIAGGAIARFISWELPFWIEVAFSAVGFVAVWIMLEPPRHRQSESGGAAPRSRDARAATTWMRLLPLALFATLVSVVPELAHFHLPSELAVESGFTPFHLGFLFAAFELLQGLGSKLAVHPRLPKPSRLLPWLSAGLLLSFACFGLRSLPGAGLGLAVYITARALVDFLIGLIGPLIAEEANRRTASSIRATALSVVSAATSLLPLGVLPLSASLMQAAGYARGYGMLSLMLVVPLGLSVLWLRRTSQAPDVLLDMPLE